MNFRFRFTAGFLVIGVAIFAITTFVVLRSARSNEESNLVQDISVKSNQTADVVSAVVTAYTGGNSGQSLIGAPTDSQVSRGFESLVMSTLLESSDIVRLSLYDNRGSLLWTSAAGAAAEMNTRQSGFAEALNGQIVTGLNKNVQYASSNGTVASGDLTSTYIPLMDQSSNSTAQVLEVAREVSGTLDFRVDNARSSMFRTLFSTLGASFGVLLGIVVVADTVINRSRRNVLAQERVAAESKVEAERLELRNKQLQDMNREHDRFLSMVSHELRTPLTSMLAFTEVLKRRQDGQNRESNLDHLDIMRRNGDHLNSLIAELLEVTEIHAEEFEIKKERFDLNGLADDVNEAATALMAPRGQRLRTALPDAGFELFADRKRILQMLVNLVSNASAYSAENTTITVEFEHRAGSVKLTVTDQGEGISEEDQKDLFEHFKRGNSEYTRSQSGLGLGLSIVKAIVDAHDGKISVKSQPGAGTEITVLIPAVAEEEAAKNE